MCNRALLKLGFLATLWPLVLFAADSRELLRQANEALNSGRTNEALAFISQAIAAQPTNAHSWFFRGTLHSRAGQPAKAVADFDRAIELEPKPIVYQHRGVEHFRLGNFDKSVSDFDKFIELAPKQAPHHWQRGISCYYAGKFEEGRKQFEAHRSVNPNDVENAVWHFICVAKASGIEKARASFMPIESDRRVPMKEIHLLFGGKATPEEVISAAQKEAAEDGLFYAHLYLGLYYEALGDKAKTREHIFKAAREFKYPHYMGDVARVHAAVLAKQK